MLGKLPVPGRPTTLDFSKASAGRRWGGVVLTFFLSPVISFFSFSFANGAGRVVRRCWLNFQCQGVLLTWITVGQGPIVLSVGAGGGCLDIFSLIYHFSILSPSLWKTEILSQRAVKPKTTNQQNWKRSDID